MSIEPLLSLSDVARQLRFSRGRLRRLVMKRLIPYVPLDGRICFRASAVAAWQASREVSVADAGSPDPAAQRQAAEDARDEVFRKELGLEPGDDLVH